MNTEERVRYLLRVASRAELDGESRVARVLRRAASELLDLDTPSVVTAAPGSSRD